MYKFFITILLFFSFSIQSYAAASRDEYLLQKQIQAVEHQNKVYGIRAVVARENVPISGTTQTQVRELIKRSIAVDTPTASKVGGSMLKRVSAYAKNPGIQMVGVMAVTQLLEAIGWVIEDGVYVKKTVDSSKYLASFTPNGPWDDLHKILNAKYDTTVEISQLQNSKYSNVKDVTYFSYEVIKCKPESYYCYNSSLRVSFYLKPRVSNETLNPLTAPLLGAIMLGRGYTDPDPNFKNDTVNTGVYTGVKEIYEHDPSGVGDEVADDMDDKLDKAPQTPDNTPSKIPDDRYDSGTLAPDTDTADRSWTEKGDEATGSTEPIKDPVTGEDTGGQSISLQFPLFCSWASKMCQWYDDWKSSDKIHQKFEEDVKNHQSDEKSFWQTVKDWFDWSKKEDDLPEKDNSDIDLNDELIIDQKTKNISWSAQCPTAQKVPINFHGVTAEITVADFSYLCSLDWLIKPFVIAFASISAAFIIFGFNRGGDDG